MQFQQVRSLSLFVWRFPPLNKLVFASITDLVCLLPFYATNFLAFVCFFFYNNIEGTMPNLRDIGKRPTFSRALPRKKNPLNFMIPWQVLISSRHPWVAPWKNSWKNPKAMAGLPFAMKKSSGTMSAASKMENASRRQGYVMNNRKVTNTSLLLFWNISSVIVVFWWTRVISLWYISLFIKYSTCRHTLDTTFPTEVATDTASTLLALLEAPRNKQQTTCLTDGEWRHEISKQNNTHLKKKMTKWNYW